MSQSAEEPPENPGWFPSQLPTSHQSGHVWQSLVGTEISRSDTRNRSPWSCSWHHTAPGMGQEVPPTPGDASTAPPPSLLHPPGSWWLLVAPFPWQGLGRAPELPLLEVVLGCSAGCEAVCVLLASVKPGGAGILISVGDISC